MLRHYKRFKEMPPALANKPTSNPVIEFYIKAFQFLSTTRTPGFSGPSPISFSEICQYAKLVRYTTADDIFFFAEVIRECDSVYMNFGKDAQNTTGE